MPSLTYRVNKLRPWVSVFSSPKLPPQCSSSCVWKLSVWTGLLFFLLFSCRRVLQKIKHRNWPYRYVSAASVSWLLPVGGVGGKGTGKWAEPKHFFLSFCPQGISPLQLAGWLYPRVINELAFKQGQQIRSPYSRSAGKWESPDTQGGLRAWAVRLSSSGQTYLSVIR